MKFIKIERNENKLKRLLLSNKYKVRVKRKHTTYDIKKISNDGEHILPYYSFTVEEEKYKSIYEFLYYCIHDNHIILYDYIPERIRDFSDLILKSKKGKLIKTLKEFKKSLTNEEKQFCLQNFNNSLCKAYGYYRQWCNDLSIEITPREFIDRYCEELNKLSFNNYWKESNWFFQNSMNY